MPHLIEFLSRHDRPDIQFEAAWALASLVYTGSSQHAQAVDAVALGARAMGAIAPLINLISSENANVAEQAVRTLGTIGSDGRDLRDAVLGNGCLELLLTYVSTHTPVTLLRSITWTIRRLCYEICLLRSVSPALSQRVQHQDREVVSNACWALSNITDTRRNIPYDKIQAVIDAGIVPTMIRLLTSDDTSVLTAALCVISNIAYGAQSQTQFVIYQGCLAAFASLLKHHKNSIQKETVLIIASVTVSRRQKQIQAFIDNGLIPPLIDFFAKGDFKSQKMAVQVIANLTSGGKMKQIEHCVECGAIGPLCEMLAVKEAEVITDILDAIIKILQAAEESNQDGGICQMIEEAGGLDKIKLLQNHKEKKVRTSARRLIETYFSLLQRQRKTTCSVMA